MWAGEEYMRGKIWEGVQGDHRSDPKGFCVWKAPHSLCFPGWIWRRPASLGWKAAAAQHLPDRLCLSHRAQSYAERLRLGLAVIHGEAQCTEQDMDDGRHSPPMVKNATVHPGLELPCKTELLCLSLRGGGKKRLLGITNLKGSWMSRVFLMERLMLANCWRRYREKSLFNSSWPCRAPALLPLAVTSQLCQTDKLLLEVCRIMKNSLKSEKKCKSGTNKGTDIETGCCPYLGGMGCPLLSPLAPGIVTAESFLHLENHIVTLQCLFWHSFDACVASVSRFSESIVELIPVLLISIDELLTWEHSAKKTAGNVFWEKWSY